MTKNTTSTFGQALRRAILAASLCAVAIPAGFAVGTDGAAFAQSAGGGGNGGGGGGKGGPGGGGGDGGGISDAMAFFVDANCTAGAACKPKPRPKKPIVIEQCSGDRVFVEDGWFCRNTY